MPSIHSTIALSLLALPWVAGHAQQKPLAESEIPSAHGDDPPRIAVVGAGIAGASAAYHLHELGSSPPAITIYEQTPWIGGRIKSHSSLGEQSPVHEFGAPHFFADDWCLTDAMDTIGLMKNSRRPWDRPRTTGVWDGEEMTTPMLECNMEQIMPWKAAQVAWKYGLSSWNMYHTVMANLGNWFSFARSESPFDSIRQEMANIGLDDRILESAKTFLHDQNISSRYQSDLVQPCSRAHFLRNLNEVGGLASLKATGPTDLISIEGGNTQLIKGMILLANADVHLESQIVKVSRGLNRRYRLSIASTRSAKHSVRVTEAEYDSVILASPLHTGSELDLSDLNLGSSAPTRIPYVATHVTHFQTSRNLAPEYFNLPADTIVPYDILTAKTSNHDPNILSITHTPVEGNRDCVPGNCDQQEDEYIYRITSRHPIKDRELVKMTGGKYKQGTSLVHYGISWVNHQAWPHAFPQTRGSNQANDKVEIAPGLFYLGGGEQVISSLEMSCRMGRNAARKLS